MNLSSVLHGLFGMLFLIAIAYVFSNNRKKINWSIVYKGILLQVIFAISITQISWVADFFDAVSKLFVKVVGFSTVGSQFLFQNFGTGQIEPALINFAVMVLPTIIFFSALTSLLYYLGILQKVVFAFGWIMKRTLKISGAESLAAAANVFLGQTEAPFMIKPYLNKMTTSEIFCLMSGGMATIAGGVLAAYVGFLGGADPIQQAFYAKHLLSASVMSAPAAIVAAKILLPETETYDQNMQVNKETLGSNILESIANGTSDGVKLAVNVAAMLLVFIALMAMLNFGLFQIGKVTHLNDWIQHNTKYDGLSFQCILGYVCSPLAWVMGVPMADITLVGQLLGEKTILNEFVAYTSLGNLKQQGAFTYEKSVIMATYVLCGFSNFASIGIQIGGIGSLVPSRKTLLSKLGFRALLAGTLACLFTAVVIGMFY